MAIKVCTKGHQFEKTSDCPVCPECSSREMNNKFGEEFPKLSAPAFRALDAVGIKTLVDISKYSEKELLALHGFGPKAIKILRPALEQRGLTFLVR